MGVKGNGLNVICTLFLGVEGVTAMRPNAVPESSFEYVSGGTSVVDRE